MGTHGWIPLESNIMSIIIIIIQVIQVRGRVYGRQYKGTKKSFFCYYDTVLKLFIFSNHLQCLVE